MIGPMDVKAEDQSAFPDAIDSTLKPSSALVPKRPLMMRIGKRYLGTINRWIMSSSRVPDLPVFDTGIFPWIAAFEAQWQDIREEAAAALQDLNSIPPLASISPDHRRIAPAGRWRSYFLMGYGYRIEENCAACPKTAAIVSSIPNINTAFFSILVPGTHIPPHTGASKALLTCHLGIQVPETFENCRMRVDEQWVHWREGKALVFDDVFQHEVHNNTDETRIVLLVQFRRPVGLVGKIVGGLFLGALRRSRFVQDARRGVAEWSAK